MAEAIEKPKRAKKAATKKAAPVEVNVDYTALQKFEAEGAETLQTVADWDLDTQEEMDLAGQLFSHAGEMRKRLEADLKEITGPMRAAETKVRERWRPAIGFWKKSEEALKTAMRRFELRRIAEQSEALKKIEDSGGTANPDTLAIAHGHNAIKMTEAAGSRQVLKWRETDPEAVPEKYFIRVLNTAMIDGELKALGGKLSIPGIEVYEDVHIRHKPGRG